MAATTGARMPEHVLLLDRVALTIGGVNVAERKITHPGIVAVVLVSECFTTPLCLNLPGLALLGPVDADFFCRTVLEYMAPPPEEHDRLFAQLFEHIFQTTKVSFPVVVIALRYYDMYARLACEFVGTAETGLPAEAPKLATQVRMVVAAIVAAAKFLDDVTYGNRSWTIVSGLPAGEVTRAEMELLDVLSYNLHMYPQDFVTWMQYLTSVAVRFRRESNGRLTRRGSGGRTSRLAAESDAADAGDRPTVAAPAEAEAVEEGAPVYRPFRSPLLTPLHRFPLFASYATEAASTNEAATTFVSNSPLHRSMESILTQDDDASSRPSRSDTPEASDGACATGSPSGNTADKRRRASVRSGNEMEASEAAFMEIFVRENDPFEDMLLSIGSTEMFQSVRRYARAAFTRILGLGDDQSSERRTQPTAATAPVSLVATAATSQ